MAELMPGAPQASAPSRPDDFEERLHLAPMSEEEIDAALEATLPDGWVCVPDREDASVYYWNTETDGTSWLLPKAPAKEDVALARELLESNSKQEVQEARQLVQRASSAKVLEAKGSAAGGASNVSWPPSRPLESGRRPSLKGFTMSKVKKTNRVLERLAKPTEPPPKPKTTKERMMELHRAHPDADDPDFDGSMFQLRQGGWTHLPPPERPKRERIKLRNWKAGDAEPGGAAAAGAAASSGGGVASAGAGSSAGSSAELEAAEAGTAPLLPEAVEAPHLGVLHRLERFETWNALLGSIKRINGGKELSGALVAIVILVIVVIAIGALLGLLGSTEAGPATVASTISPSSIARAEVAAAKPGGPPATTTAPLVLPDRTGKPGMASIKMQRQQSSKVKAAELERMLQQQTKERRTVQRKGEEEAKRKRRLAEYEKSINSLWEDQWAHVQLVRLPSDVAPGVLAREPGLAEALANLLKEYFADLFDIYLYYAKVDSDSASMELYKMTDFNWKALLKEAKVVGDQPGMLSTSVSSTIFKTVNQRRDNMEQSRGKTGQGATSGQAQAADYTKAAMKAIVEIEPSKGFGSSVMRSHYAAGSLYAFTFSEYLEGLICTALELATGAKPPPAGGLDSEYVLTSVRYLLEEHVLPNCCRGEVLDFRYTLANSATLSEAIDVIRPLIDPLYDKYADMPIRVVSGKPGMGFSLRNFLEMCQEASLVGAQLSHVQVKTVFVNSLQISTDADAARKPLLNRNEFQEAICRIAYRYDASKDPDLGGGSGSPAGKKKPRTSLRKVGGSSNTAAHVASTIKEQISLTPRKGEGGEEAEHSEMELGVVANLPIVCGKLLALLEQLS